MSQDRPGEVTRHQEPWVKFPKWLLGVSTPNEKAVLMALSSHGGEIFPSHAVLAHEAGCSVATLKRVLVELKRKGWISWQERFRSNQQTTNVYQLHLGDLEWNPPSSNRATRSLNVSDRVAQDELPGSSQRATERDLLNKNSLTRHTHTEPAAPAPPVSRENRRVEQTDYQPDAKHVPQKLRSICTELIDCWQDSLLCPKDERSFKFFVSELEKIRTDPNGGIQAVKETLGEATGAEINGSPWRKITHTKWRSINRTSGLTSQRINDRPGPPLPPLSEVYPADDPHRIYQ